MKLAAAAIVLVLLGLVTTAAAVRNMPVPQLGMEQQQALVDDGPDIEEHDGLNHRPVVGILTQYCDKGDTEWCPRSHSYFPASYVKMIESGGARVVPFLHDMPEHEIRRRFDAVNGFLIPGGGQPLRPGHPWYDSSELVMKLALDANDKDDYFPVLGICLGFETMAVVTAGTDSILGNYQASDTAAPLMYTHAAGISQLFSRMDPAVRHALQDRPYAREAHVHGLPTEAFYQNPDLRKMYRVLSLSIDKVGKVYVSTFEGKTYPFTGLQWHPEKNTYEWGPAMHIPHGEMAAEVTHSIARFFVNQTRHNHHKARDWVEEDEMSIYNFAPVFSGRHRHDSDNVWADESYVFPPWEDLQKQKSKQ